MGIKAVATIRKNKKHLLKLQNEAEMKYKDINCNIQSNGKVSLCQWKEKISNYLPPTDNTTKK